MKLTHQIFCAIFIFALSAFEHVQSVSWDFSIFFCIRLLLHRMKMCEHFLVEDVFERNYKLCNCVIEFRKKYSFIHYQAKQWLNHLN